MVNERFLATHEKKDSDYEGDDDQIYQNTTSI